MCRQGRCSATRERDGDGELGIIFGIGNIALEIGAKGGAAAEAGGDIRALALGQMDAGALKVSPEALRNKEGLAREGAGGFGRPDGGVNGAVGVEGVECVHK
jgi:hypothetical protein